MPPSSRHGRDSRRPYDKYPTAEFSTAMSITKPARPPRQFSLSENPLKPALSFYRRIVSDTPYSSPRLESLAMPTDCHRTMPTFHLQTAPAICGALSPLPVISLVSRPSRTQPTLLARRSPSNWTTSRRPSPRKASWRPRNTSIVASTPQPWKASKFKPCTPGSANPTGALNSHGGRV